MSALQSSIYGSMIELVSKTCAFVKTWSQRLEVSPEVYLEQLLTALQKQNGCSSHLMKTKINATDDNDVGREHIFEVEKNFMIWKKYFPEKQVHGKRGVIPIQEAEYSTAVWLVLQEALKNHLEAQLQNEILQETNNRLEEELKKALTLTDESVRAKEEFKSQNYAKFCALLNTKKAKIRQLEEALSAARGTPGSSGVSVPEASTSGAGNRAKLQPNIQASSRGELTEAAACITGISDDGFDSDTDVDEPQCDTDEENDAMRKRSAEKRKIVHHASDGDLSDGGNHCTPEERHKKTAMNDFQDDLFNSSVEGTSLALLSNIKPRVTDAPKVSNARITRQAFCKTFSGTAMSKGLSSCIASADENHDVEDSPASVVANILAKNVMLRRARGIEMPRREDDYDLLVQKDSRHALANASDILDDRLSWALCIGQEGGRKASSPEDFHSSGTNAALDDHVKSNDNIQIHDERTNGEESSSGLKKFPVLPSEGLQSSSKERAVDKREEKVAPEFSVCSEVYEYECDTELSAEEPATDESVVILDESRDTKVTRIVCQLMPLKENSHLRSDQKISSFQDCRNAGNQANKISNQSHNFNLFMDAESSGQTIKNLDNHTSQASNLYTSNEEAVEPERITACKKFSARTEPQFALEVEQLWQSPTAEPPFLLQAEQVRQSPAANNHVGVTCYDEVASSSNKRECDQASCARKKTRVVESDLVKHKFRSGSVIEEIFM
ncbi:uncharacterized protein LOC108675555 isoform X2 [Hyalella azteca]|uniref:Uncharacterized protein LOC108675555 isoform X2 n=1 Tax=Hyalella azteca TaxID=294128 RepID=A0A8B7NZ11_HYAAZ|nr:uncharacterized protein LOC108675555 isoform X2 [Hyalella azteca]